MTAARIDLVSAGEAFQDLIFVGLPRMPRSGEELRTQSLHAAGEVVLIGSPALTQRYMLALQASGTKARTLGAEATWAGLHALHTHSHRKQ